jgi:N-acetylglucosamine kinase-like BadF-type ATPase
VSDFIYGKMPEKLIKKLKTEFQLDTEKALNKVYKSESPNRWLASFSFFIRDNIKEEYCRNIVLDSFRAFFDCHISQYGKYKDLPLGVAGSVAFHYKDFLQQVSEEYGFKLTRIEKSPIEALVAYHNKKEKKTNAK